MRTVAADGEGAGQFVLKRTVVFTGEGPNGEIGDVAVESLAGGPGAAS